MARILNRIIYTPDYYSAITVMLTRASISLVIEAKWQWLGQEIIDLKGTITTDDFLFKINSNTSAVDETHSSWASISYIDYNTFINTTIPNTSRVWIECTNLDFVITDFILLTKKATINLTNAVQVLQHYQAVSSDILFSLPSNNVTLSVSSGVAATIFYGERDSAAYLVNDDFTVFDKNITQVTASLNAGKAAHIHFRNTVALTNPTNAKTINVTFSNGIYEIAQIEVPFKKARYPYTTNPKCLETVAATKCTVLDSDGYIFSNCFDFANWANGQSCSFFTDHFVGSASASEAYFGAASTGTGASRVTMYSQGAILFGTSYFGASAQAYAGYWKNCLVVTKISGTTLNVKQYINGNMIVNVTAAYNSTIFTDIKNAYLANRIINLDNPSQHNLVGAGGAMMKRQTKTMILFGTPTKKQIEEAALDIITFTPNLHWNFSAETGATVPELITGRDATLVSSSGTRINYFN